VASIKTIARRAWGALGPGLTTGAADDDPSGIATYSQAGAQFGNALTWSLLLTLPFMVAIQLISALIGWHTRRGLAANIATTLPRWVLLLLVALLVVANTVNIAADLAAALNRRAGAAVRGRFRADVPCRRDPHLLPQLCRISEVPDLGTFRLCGHGLHGRCAVGFASCTRLSSRLYRSIRIFSP
jgi:hypothetical protein